MKKERYIVALFKRIAVMMALFGVPSAAVAGGVTDPACLLPFHSVVRDLAIEHHLQPTLQGRVVDGETGEPLIGASVYIQGTAIGTSTQSDGTFNLTTDRLVDVLVISYVATRPWRSRFPQSTPPASTPSGWPRPNCTATES